MKKGESSKVLLILVLAIITIYSGIEMLKNAEAKQSISQQPQTNYSQACTRYTTLTQTFQNNGLPYGFKTKSINKINNRYLSLLIANPSFNNRLEIYIYDLGADNIINTSDDSAILIDENPHESVEPIIISNSSNNIAYWLRDTNSTIKIMSCILTAQGCSNITTVSDLATNNISIGGIALPQAQDRFFIAYGEKYYPNSTLENSPFYNTYSWCSLTQPMATDGCSRSLSSFSAYISQDYGAYKTLNEIGFISINVSASNPLNELTIFDINLQIPNFTHINESGVNLDSAKSIGYPLFLVIKKTGNVSEMALIEAASGLVTTMDLLDFEAMNYSINYQESAIDLTNSGIVAAYRSRNNRAGYALYGETALSPAQAKLIYSTNRPEEIRIRAILSDNLVIGLLPIKEKAILFNCKP